MRRAFLVVALVAVAGDARAQEPPVDIEASIATPTTGAVRGGVYTDSDNTTVWRTLATIAPTWGRWTLNAAAAVDIVSSASIDVRSSPLGKVEVVSGASGTSSTTGGTMSDRRIQVTSGLGWRDGGGHAVAFSGSFANERDYDSVSGGINGSVDVNRRMTTLLGGVTFTDNWIASMLDPGFAQRMYEVGASLGVAEVLSTKDAIRLRYDGAVAEGYQASPYRFVRFGDWTATPDTFGHLVFTNTIGSADGLAERLPDSRVRHAAVLEWVHSLSDALGLHASARLGLDSWGIESATGTLELRAAMPSWRLQLGYRFYAQSSADFFASKYTSAPSSYTYYTSDKELGREIGNAVTLDLAKVLAAPQRPGDTAVLLDFKVVGLHYDYPGFLLLGSRSSVFFDVGITWDPS